MKEAWLVVNAFLRTPSFIAMENAFLDAAKAAGVRLNLRHNASFLRAGSLDNPPPFALFFDKDVRLAQAMERDFSDGLRIVCNTTVCNEELMDHLRPQVIVAADPALHFGVSRYAARFREHLVRAMERHGSYLFMPLGYWPLFVRRYPELADRTFGVPVVPAKPENVSLNFAKFKLDYVPQKEDGSAMPAVQMAWNIAANTPKV